MRRVGWETDTEREAAGWKLPVKEPSEIYLGVAAKQPGDTVIIS